MQQYPDIPIDLYLRAENPFLTPLSEEQGDQNWQWIEDALNTIRPIIQAINAAGGIANIISGLPKTGDFKHTISTTVDTGWLLIDNSYIGSSASTATYKGGVYQPLYSLIWNFATTNDFSPTGKGVSAVADWNANKALYLPDVCGRVLVAAGQGRAGLTNRIFGSKFGQEYYTDSRTYSITSIPVSGSTPSISTTVNGGDLVASGTPAVTFSSMGNVTFPTFNGGAFPALTGGALPSSSGGSFPTLTGGTLPSSSGGSFPSYSIVAASPPFDILTIPHNTCVLTNEGGGTDVMGCADLVVNSSDVAAALKLNSSGGAFPSFSPGSFQTLTSGSFPTFNAGSFQTLTSGTLPTSTGGNPNVSGAAATVDVGSITISGTITVPSAALNGVTASGSTGANPVNIPTVQPSFAPYLLIKI